MLQKYTPPVKATSRKPRRKNDVKRSLLALLNSPLNNSTVSLPYGLPERLRIPLRYSTTFSVDADADVDNTFSLNGVYDPDFTQAGHQPFLFDQLMAMYERYRVVKTGIRFSYSPVASTNAGAVLVAIWRTLSASTMESSSINSVVDRTGMVSKVTNGIGSQYAPMVSAEDKICDLTDVDKTAPGLYGNSGSNPSTQAYAHCYVASLDGSTLLSGRAFVEMVYDVEFSRRAIPNSSVDAPPVEKEKQSATPVTPSQAVTSPTTRGHGPWKSGPRAD